MASTITADNGVLSGIAGIKYSADNSGILQLAVGTGNTALTLDASSNLTAVSNLTANNITSNNNLVVTNNLGIGNTSPSFPLTVVTNNTSGVGLGTYGRTSDNLAGTYWFSNNGATTYGTILASATEFRHTSTPAAAVQTFYTNAAERIRIDANGNFLLGTTTSPTGTKELVLGGDYIEGVVAIGNSGTTQTLSLANGTFQTVTLTGNCTFTMPTAVAGKSFILMLVQDATGGRSASFTSVKWPSGTAPTITTTASTGFDIISFFSNGTNWYGSAIQSFS